MNWYDSALIVSGLGALGSALVWIVRWLVNTAIPLRRELYIEGLIREEQQRKHHTEHTCLRYGLDYARVLIRNDLIQKGLATGKQADPVAIFNDANTSVPSVSLTHNGYWHYRIARKLPFITWLNRRYVSATCSECIDADSRIRSKIGEYTHLRSESLDEFAVKVKTIVFSEFWETFFYSKGFSGGPIAFIHGNRGFLFYAGRRVDEVEASVAMQRVAEKR